MPRLATVLALAAFALLVAACGNAAAGPATPAPSADPSTPRIVADRLAFLDREVTIPAGKAVKLSFENRESAPHNVTIARDASYADKVFEGEIISTSTVDYEIPALDAGSYVFRCDVHPEMTGRIVAE